MQRWLRNVQKSVMHVQSCCFTDVNLLPFLPFSLPSASLLPKLPFVVIQTFCHHGNVTSHFSSLLLPLKTAYDFDKALKARVGGRGHLGIFWAGMCRPGLQIGTAF